MQIARRNLLLGGMAVLALPPTLARAEAKRRIVTIGGAMTEIVFALGHGDEVVAVDTTSLYPFERTDRLPKVGYLRALATEGILSMQPDLILADRDAGPPNVVNQLKGMGVDFEQFPDKPGAETVAAKTAFVGRAVGAVERAGEIATAYVDDLKALRGTVEKLSDRPSVLFLLNAGTNGLRGAGVGTGADDMIRLAGGINAFGAASGYQTVSPESAMTANPDFILMMQQSVDELGGMAEVGALPALASLDATAKGRIVGMNGDYLLGFGPRTAHAGRDLAAALHPQALIPSLPARPWVGT